MSVAQKHIADIPSYIFGAGSTLCNAAESSTLPISVGVSAWFVLMAFGVVVAYLMWLNHWGASGNNHRALFHFLGYHRGDYSVKLGVLGPTFSRYIYSGTLLGFLSTWVIVVAMFDIGTTANVRLGFMILAGIILVYLYQQLVVYIIGVVTGSVEFVKVILKLKGIFYTLMAMIVIPTGLCYFLSQGVMQQTFMYIVATQIIALVLLFIYETFILFVTKKVSLFHTILYLCAVEIFPLTLIWGFFSR